MFDLKNTTIKTPVMIQHETESVVSSVTTDKGVTLYGLTNSKLACAFILTNKHKRTADLRPAATLRISIDMTSVSGGEITDKLIREWDVLHFNSLFSVPKDGWVPGGINDGVPFLHDAVKALIMAEGGWEAIIDADDPVFYGEGDEFFLVLDNLKIDIDVSVVDRFSVVSTKIEFDDAEVYSYYHDKLLSAPTMTRSHHYDQNFNALNGELGDKLRQIYDLHKKPVAVEQPAADTDERLLEFPPLREYVPAGRTAELIGDMYRNFMLFNNPAFLEGSERLRRGLKEKTITVMFPSQVSLSAWLAHCAVHDKTVSTAVFVSELTFSEQAKEHQIVHYDFLVRDGAWLIWMKMAANDRLVCLTEVKLYKLRSNWRIHQDPIHARMPIVELIDIENEDLFGKNKFTSMSESLNRFVDKLPDVKYIMQMNPML